MLKLHNLSRIYQTDEVETVALNSVNIEIEQGEFVCHYGAIGLRQVYLAKHYRHVG